MSVASATCRRDQASGWSLYSEWFFRQEWKIERVQQSKRKKQEPALHNSSRVLHFSYLNMKKAWKSANLEDRTPVFGRR